ncbi:MAG: hypothetical protein KKA84_01370 [Bacteroidetes bacterium]|nr:hypothetical protein [Bacteroidota bacterium]
MSKIIIVFVLFQGLVLLAQNSEHEFDFQQIIGEIESTDQFSQSMGIYDGYEIPLYEGENIEFLLYTEQFNPTFILVDPSGKTFKQIVGDQFQFARLRGVIPESGDWYLYVSSKESQTGQYFLQNAIGPETAFNLSAEASFCEKLSFILAHARASFQLLGDEKGSKVEFKGEKRKYLDQEDGSYHSILYEGKDMNAANKLLDEWKIKIIACVGETWITREHGWTDVGDFKLKDIILSGTDLVNNKLQIVFRITELKNKDKDPTRTTSFELIFKIVQ